MKNKIIIAVCIVVAILSFVGIYALYNSLSDDYKTDNLAPTSAQNQAIQNNSQSGDENTDYSAPDFTVQNENGSDVTLSSYFGKPIVLNLWASWCSPCKNEMPYFEEAYKENDDIQFLMVNMTSGDNKSDAKEFIKEEGYTFPVFYDIYGEAAYMYQAESLPMTIFIDANGNMVTYGVGAFDKETLQKGIEMLK